MTVVQIVDPRAVSDAKLDRVHEFLAELHAEENAREHYRSPADTRGFLRHSPAWQPAPCWVVESAGHVVGFARLVLVEGSTVGYTAVGVAPTARRQGIGRALLDAVTHHAREEGCGSLVGGHGTSAGAAFASSVGATDARRDVRSLLSLAEADLEVAPVVGYALERWVGAAPERLVVSYAHARDAINDAPRTSDDEWAPWDVGRVRAEERALVRRGREMHVTVALDAERKVAAFTELRVSRAPGVVASTEDTAVVRGQRGKGLARWVKAESLRELRNVRPDVDLVSTTNAEENTAIRRVNERLGFVPVATYTTCVLRL